MSLPGRFVLITLDYDIYYFTPEERPLRSRIGWLPIPSARITRLQSGSQCRGVP